MKIINRYVFYLFLITFSCSSLAGVTWKTVNPSPTANSLQGIIWTGSQYVGVTKGGSIFTSSDLTSYSSQAVSSRDLTQVAYNGSQYIAIGAFGTILSSTDTNVWSNVNSGTRETLNAIVWTGAKWVVVGTKGIILTSTDGTSWTNQTSGTTSNLTSIAWSGNQLLAGIYSSTTGNILSSTDGTTWTSVSNSNIASIIWDGSQFVGIHVINSVTPKTPATSADGVNWRDKTALGSSASAIYWNGSEYLVVGDKFQSAYTSSDLQTWSTSFVGTNSSINHVASQGGMQWAATLAQGRILETTDGSSWIDKSTNLTALQHLNDVIYANNQFVAVGDAGIILTSSDGSSWTSQTSGTTADLRAVTWSGSQYLTVAKGTGFGAAANTVVLTSTDGVNWSQMNTDFRTAPRGIAANGNAIVVGGNSLYATTDKGATWQQIAGFYQGTVTGLKASDVLWNGSTFIAVSDYGTAISSDGVNWSSSVHNTYNPTRLIWDGQRFVGVGGGKARIYTSTNGLNWANISNTKTPFALNDILFSNGSYITVSSATGQIYRNQWDSFQSSMILNLGNAASPKNFVEEVSGQGDSGRIWSSTTKPSFGINSGLSSLASDGKIIVAVGTDATILTRPAATQNIFTPCSAGTGFGALNVTGSAVSRVRDCFIPTSGNGSSNYTWAAPNVAPVGLATPEWTLSVSTTLVSMSAGLDRWITTSLSGLAGLGITVDATNHTVTFSKTTLNGSGGSLVLEGTVSYSATVADTTKPVITLNGNATVTVAQNASYSDAGATASDNIDGDITANIVVTNAVDTSVAGSYTVRYNVSDTAGNAANEATRNVTVTAATDTTRPVITLNGSSSISIDQGVSYTDAGASATDDTDGDITTQIVVTNPVDTSVIGSYTVRYNVIDAAGNAALEISRTVTVQAVNPGSGSSSGSSSNTSSGGGSFNQWMLLFMLSLLFSRRFKQA